MLIGIGNLTYTTTEEEVRQLFESSGAVERINLGSDCETGRLRGFGFVDMPDTRAAQAAVQGLQGTALTGRTLHVTEAKPRAPHCGFNRSR